MFRKLVVGLIAMAFLGSMASAQVAARVERPVEKGTKVEKGREVLKGEREKARDNRDALKRVGVEEQNLSNVKDTKGTAVDLSATKNADTKANVAKDAVKSSAAKVNTKSEAFKAKEADVLKLINSEREVAAMTRIASKISETSAEAVMRLPNGENYNTVKRLSLILVKQVEAGKVSKEAAERIITSAAKSPEVLEGKLIVGENADKCFATFQGQAIENYAEFIEWGVKEGKDAKTVLDAMTRASTRKFREGVTEARERICKLALAPCNLFSNPIKTACSGI